MRLFRTPGRALAFGVQRWGTLLRFSGCGLLALWMVTGCSPVEEGKPNGPGPKAPDFSLQRLGSDERVGLADLQGKVVILDFWATWCLPCIDQIPALNAFHAAHAEDPAVLVFGVSADLEGAENVAQWVKEKGVRYPILLGGASLAQDFGAPGFPVTYFLDRQGRIQKQHVGVIQAEELERDLAEMSRDASG